MDVPWWVWPQSVVWVLMHLYLWWRLVANTTARRSRPRRLGTIALVALAPSVPGALVAMHTLDPAGGRWATWPGFVWYGLLVYLLLILVLTEPFRVVLAVLRRVRRRSAAGRNTEQDAEPGAERAEVDAGRRRVLARGIALGAGALALGVVGYGAGAAFSTPRLERVVIRLPRLPRAAAGYRIALVADTHIGPFLGESHVRQVVEIVNGTRPDIVVIPGDLIDGTVRDLRETLAPLRELRSRGGTYFTTGNHEYLFDADAWMRQLRRMGIRVLRNERVALPHFDLAGVNDLSGAYLDDPPDYRRALGGRDTGRPVILLAHQPVQAREAARYGVDLQLSGHTHGGQFFPGSVLTSLGQPVLSGHGRVGGTQLYVTRGTGFWGPPVRVGATPEVTLLELTPA